MKPIVKPIIWNKLSFCEKIFIYKMLLDERHALYTDKIEAKRIAERHGVKVAKLIRVLNNPDDITTDDLNDGWILKSSHACQQNIWLHDGLDLDEIKQSLHLWNKPFTAMNEPHYKYIEPRFFIEERIRDKYLGTAGSLVYMIRCIYGSPIPILRVRYNGKSNTYDFDWKLLEPAGLEFPIEKPVQMDRMIQLASTMARQFEFVRIDFYVDDKDEIYFSEYTFTPNGGYPIGSNHLDVLATKYWPGNVRPKTD